MGIAVNTLIVVWLVAFALPSAGQNSQTRLATAQQVLSAYTERVRWQHYWLPGTVSEFYVSGSQVQAQALFSPTAAGFCAAALVICQIYERNVNGGFEFLTEWEPENDHPEVFLPARFAEEYAKAKALRPVQGIAPVERPKEQRTFDTTKLAEPMRSQQSSKHFDSALSFAWKLLPLTPPKSVATRTPPSDASLLRGEVLTAVKRFRNGCGPPGEAVIPFYSSHDPRVFVYVDLGGRCEKGVFEFLGRTEGGWSFSRFVVDELDVKPLVPRIQRARMETLSLTGWIMR